MMPGLAAWSPWVAAVVLLGIFFPTIASGICCPGEQGPISNCSFKYINQNGAEETEQCRVLHERKGGYSSGGGCPHYAYVPGQSVPRSVLNLTTRFFYTSCGATMLPAHPVRASSCHTSCRDSSRDVYVGLNITFNVDEYNTEVLEQIQFSLHYGSYVWCHYLDFGANGISYLAAKQHQFYFDGFVGLQPYEQYVLTVTTLPTDTTRRNEVSTHVQVPLETCWKPDLMLHDTPFAINLTLFEDEEHSFTTFEVILYSGSNPSKTVDFMTSNVYEIDGKRGTNILFDCIEPSSDELKIYIRPVDCPTCRWSRTEVQVKASPPSVSHCPSDITQDVEMSGADTIDGIAWSEPLFNFTSCRALREGIHTFTNRSHESSGTAAFRVNRTTLVSYSAFQWGKVASCNFSVTVIPVDTTPPIITYCPPNITALAQPGQKEVAVHWNEPLAEDFSPLRFIPSLRNGSLFLAGRNVSVSYKVVDAFNNSVEGCTFHVFVADTPVASTLIITLSCVIGLSLAIAVILCISCKHFGQRTSIDPPNHDTVKMGKDDASRFGEVDPKDAMHMSQISFDVDLEPNNCRTSVHGWGWSLADFRTCQLTTSMTGPNFMTHFLDDDRSGSRNSMASSQYTGSCCDSPVSLETTC